MLLQCMCVCGGGVGGRGRRDESVCYHNGCVEGVGGGEMGQCVVVTMHVLGVGAWAGER